MSSIAPVLSHDNEQQLILWIKQQCSSPDFNASSPDFQAAIALLASSDSFRRRASLNLTDPSDITLVTNNFIQPTDFTSLAQILIFRSIIRRIPISPQIQRSAVPMPTPNNNNAGNTSLFSFSFLTDHKSELFQDHKTELTVSSAEQFRNGFFTGHGHPLKFMTDRRVAILRSSLPKLQSPGYRQITDLEINKLQSAQQQHELRNDVIKYSLDPLSNTLPEIALFRHSTPPTSYHISPQHINIITSYDMPSNVESSQMTSHLKQIITQANKFRNTLLMVTQRQKSMQKTLDQYFKKKKDPWNSLKKKDYAKYLETVKQKKGERIQQILDQTDHYMKELSEKIRLTHSTIIENDHPVNCYDFDLKLPEDVVQPEHLTGTLKEYQVKGLQWLVSLYQSHLNGILADEMGLGKTIQTIALLAWLFEKKNDTGPHLICAPLGTLPNWENEFKQWFPQFKVIKYIGNPKERKELERHYINRNSTINAILTSYQFVVQDKSVLSRLDYSYIVIDEAHKLKNHEGKLSQTLSHNYRGKNRLLLTGTPLQNNPRELWSLLNFILPNIFKDHKKFDDWFTAPFAKAGEAAKLTQEEQWLVITQLHAVLRPFIFRRMKADVADQLPDKKEATIICAMSAWQHSMYLTMEESSVMVRQDMKVIRMDNKQMQCRKICNHPFLFYDTYYLNSTLIRSCGKFELLDRILPKFFNTHHRVLIFSQMTELLDLLEDLLKYLQYKYLRLDGSTKNEERQQYMEMFNAPGSEYFAFLLSTRAGGLGLNLQTADTVIIYDNDWNPFADMQASARVHRIGQEKEVLVLNLNTSDSVERKVLKVQGEKRQLEDIIIGVAKFDDESNMDERKAVYQTVTAKNQTGGQTGIMSDEQINKIIARTPEEYDIFTQMDIERDARYQKEWEQAGNVGDYPRLITYEELPEFLKIPISELTKEDELPDIRKSRSKNKLSELDSITDAEYTRYIELGLSPQEHIAEIQNLRAECGNVIEKVKEILGNRFDTLPSQKDLPDYYQIITDPITFNQIKKKQKKGEYESVNALLNDLRLMASNAMKYNLPDTILYNDAKKLNKFCERMENKVKKEIPEEATQLDF
ncbi:Chromatin structure-remodeling complex subunit snf21 [Histomonas meleagridis]|uniref:Chromatin structure-remodeling complex subunit snf21 n=1 Tax=Histomonas meleagridis TaxID=135588 RepID=UPI00355A903F|nr:Chromatin structure-remodeling complex subunit snf21 [Histomonas meleagridis]KAH0799040.1 Chromatin structure-remodeling complex subunit snf21 [Histomonas meleagridis]